jgi:hypothetical protein
LSGFNRAGRKAFFCEEKKQETFMSLSRFFLEAYATIAKFLVLFFKKEPLASRRRKSFRLQELYLAHPSG